VAFDLALLLEHFREASFKGLGLIVLGASICMT